MSLVKSTTYAPDIFKSLRGFLLVHKPAGLHPEEFIRELKLKISDQLNEYDPRPLETRLSIQGNYDEEKKLVELPDLSDHPLVVGPRYNPWEIRMSTVPPVLSTRSSGVMPVVIGPDIKYLVPRFYKTPMVSVYQLTGRFGYLTDTMFEDGRIIDKTTFKHIKSWKIDNILSKIQSTQRDRLFQISAVPLDSEEAYQLAKAWPSRPPRMARWPVIFRLRCTHFELPEFKVEVTIQYESQQFLAQLIQDIGLGLKSSAYVCSIRRVKYAMFDISDCLTSSEWDLQSIINNINLHRDYSKVLKYIKTLRLASSINLRHDPTAVARNIDQHRSKVEAV